MAAADPMTCHATSKSSGRRCQRPVMPGQKVCRYHGGSSPQALAKARERLLQLVDPAIARLSVLIDKAESDTVRLQAAKDILDRAGLNAKQQIEHSGPDGGPIEIADTAREQIASRIAELAARAGEATPPS